MDGERVSRVSRVVVGLAVVALAVGGGWARAAHADDVSRAGRLRAISEAVAGGDADAVRALVPKVTDAQLAALDLAPGDRATATDRVGESTAMSAVTVTHVGTGRVAPYRFYVQQDMTPGPVNELLRIEPYLVSLGPR